MSLELIFRDDNKELEYSFTVTVENDKDGTRRLTFVRHDQVDNDQPTNTSLSKFVAAATATVNNNTTGDFPDHHEEIQGELQEQYEELLRSSANTEEEAAWLTSLFLDAPYIESDHYIVDMLDIAMLRLLSGQPLPASITIDDDRAVYIH